MECFECKSEIPDGARRCRYCGASQPIIVTQPRRGGCLRIILCIVIIIIALWIIGTSLDESKETKLKQSPTTLPNITETKANDKPSATISIKPQNEVPKQKKIESKITVSTQESTTASSKNESHIDISADRCPYCYSKQPSWADNPLEFVRRFGCIGAPTIIGIIIVIFYLLANYWD